MQPSIPTKGDLTGYYATALDALYKIAHSYFFLGKLGDAQRLLQTSLNLTKADEAASRDRLRLLLLYGRVLNVNHLIQRGDSDLLFSIISQARQVAEAAETQQGIAEALSLLGQAHCNATTVATIASGALPFGPRGQGKYEEAFAYQQQALQLQEALHDTRGMSESLFGIGLIYQFWQQNEQAREHFTRAIQVAEKGGHILEQAEPHRHLMLDASFRGDLEAALSHALSALSFREAGAFKPYQPFDHLALRDIYLKMGDTTRAELHLQQATALAEAMGFSELISSLTETMDRLGVQSEEV